MIVPLYADFGGGWRHLGSVTLVGNASLDLNNIVLPAKPKKVAFAALQDVLAEKIENSEQ
jgi:hypothetical protein